jgi:hypothetical protein
VIRLSNGEEIRTENAAEINSNVIKAEIKAIMVRYLIEQYRIYYRTFYGD